VAKAWEETEEQKNKPTVSTTCFDPMQRGRNRGTSKVAGAIGNGNNFHILYAEWQRQWQWQRGRAGQGIDRDRDRVCLRSIGRGKYNYNLRPRQVE